MGVKEDEVRQRIHDEERARQVEREAELEEAREYANRKFDMLMSEIDIARQRVSDLVEPLDWSRERLITFSVPDPRWWNRKRRTSQEMACYRLGNTDVNTIVRWHGEPSFDSFYELMLRSDGQLIIADYEGPVSASMQSWSMFYSFLENPRDFEAVTVHRLENVLKVLRDFQPPADAT